MRLTNEERAALRRAVNAHPDLKQVAPDVHVSSLNKDGLLALATSLGINPATMQVAAPVVTSPIHKVEVMGDIEKIDIVEPDAIETAIDDELARIRGVVNNGRFRAIGWRSTRPST